MQMGAFGRRLRPGPVSFMDAPVDPNAAPVPNASASFAAPAPVTPVVPKPMGVFGRIRHWATPEHLQALGATMRQLGGVNGALSEEMQRQQAAAANLAQATRLATEDEWRRRQQERTDARQARLDEQEQRDREHDNANDDASLQETVRYHRATEGGSGGGGGFGGSGPFSPETVQDLGAIVALSGMPVGDLTGSRDRRVNSPVIEAAMATRRRLHLSPGDYAAVRLAYAGDRRSYGALQEKRDAVAANEGAARAALMNLVQLQNAVPRDQMSSIPMANDALQALNARLRGEGPLGAYVGGLVTARAEYARVISGNNSPPVEAMHEAERMLPNNITPQALHDVLANLEREMEFRTEAFDAVLGDIRDRVGFDAGGEQQPQGPNTSRFAPAAQQPAPVQQQTRRIRLNP